MEWVRQKNAYKAQAAAIVKFEKEKSEIETVR